MDFELLEVKNISNDNFEEKLIKDNSRYAFYFDNIKGSDKNEWK